MNTLTANIESKIYTYSKSTKQVSYYDWYCDCDFFIDVDFNHCDYADLEQQAVFERKLLLALNPKPIQGPVKVIELTEAEWLELSSL